VVFFEVWSSSLASNGWWLLVVSNLYSLEIEVLWVITYLLDFFYLLYFFTLWVLFFEFLFEKLGTLENGEAIGLQGEGPCTRSSTDCPYVQHVRGRATRLTWTRQSNSTFHGLLGMCPCNESHVNDMSDSVRHALFPAQASLTLKWVCAPEVSVGKARCNIPRQGPAKAICIEHVGTMKIQY
jgi:hypothetical protein